MDKTQIHARLVEYFSNSLPLLAAFWPVFCWYILRTFDGSDEPWGLLALASAAYFIADSRKGFETSNCRPRRYSVIAFILLAVYALTFSIAPHLVQGIIMVATLWFWFGGMRSVKWRWAILGLLLLSLPIVPSINFFAGYPLRLLVTQVAQLMLGCVGLAATRDGTLLVIGGHPVSIDAPCSGISMLWVEFYTAMVLACYFKLDTKRTSFLSAAAMGLVLLANSVRAVALILFDRIAQNITMTPPLSTYEPTVHVGIGVSTFIATVAASVAISIKLSNTERAPQESDNLAQPRVAALSSSQAPALSSILLYSLCICAATVPLFAHTSNAVQLSMPPPAWPKEILGHPVTAVHALEEEKAFAAEFPGQMRRFTDGSNSYFVRIVNKETRQLHPSSDCFKGMGYSIEPQPLVVSSDGTHWSSFIARKGSECYKIMEQLHDKHGHAWADVSQWYWHALMHETEGPWCDITVASPL